MKNTKPIYIYLLGFCMLIGARLLEGKIQLLYWTFTAIALGLIIFAIIKYFRK